MRKDTLPNAYKSASVTHLRWYNSIGAISLPDVQSNPEGPWRQKKKKLAYSVGIVAWTRIPRASPIPSECAEVLFFLRTQKEPGSLVDKGS